MWSKMTCSVEQFYFRRRWSENTFGRFTGRDGISGLLSLSSNIEILSARFLKFEVDFFFGNAIKSLGGGGQGGQGRAGGRSDAGS